MPTVARHRPSRHRAGRLSRGLCLLLAAAASTAAVTAAAAGSVSTQETAADAAIRVTDARGRSVALAAPARRIVALAPHLTEQLFAIGAGERVVGAIDHSDYPPAATEIPRVGSADRLDLERLLSLAPDLVLAWSSGGNRAPLQRLESLGLTVYYAESRSFEDVARSLETLGLLTGQEAAAQRQAQAFRSAIAELRARHAGKPPVRVFYQVWDRPLMTISDDHIIGEAIALCGGINLFGDSGRLVPRIGMEDLLAADPEVIVSGGPGEDDDRWLEGWRQWPQLQATATGQLYFIPPALIQRHGPRLVEGSRRLCAALDAARRTAAAAAPSGR